MDSKNEKSLGQSIDEVIRAIKNLDEATRIIVLKAVIEHLEIPFSKPVINTEPIISNPNLDPTNVMQEKGNLLLDIKTLKENKKPSNSIEMACIVAFYVSNNAPLEERRDYITNKDIEKFFKQANYPLPKSPNQVPVDAKAAGYFDSTVRGQYKLNPVGYNLVAHKLPKKNTK